MTPQLAILISHEARRARVAREPSALEVHARERRGPAGGLGTRIARRLPLRRVTEPATGC